MGLHCCAIVGLILFRGLFIRIPRIEFPNLIDWMSLCSFADLFLGYTTKWISVCLFRCRQRHKLYSSFPHHVHREIFKFWWRFFYNPFWLCCFRGQHDIYMPFHVLFFSNESSPHSPWNISTIDSLIWVVFFSLYYEWTLLWFHHPVKDHIFFRNICFILLWITAVIYHASAFYFCKCFHERYIFYLPAYISNACV